jgi:acetyl-CoA acyltransferase 2
MASEKEQTLYILSGKRTPFGAYGGSLKDWNPSDLSAAAGRAALEQAKVTPEQIQHVILGNVLHSAGDSIYTPRHMGLKLGVPKSVPALGINRLCGSGFQVLIEAYHQMLAGDTDCALVGGVENMSLTPYVLKGARWGLRMGHSEMSDMMTEALTDSYVQIPMAITAENLAVQYKISKEDSDAFALRSQQLAAAAAKEGRFRDEIVPVEIKDRKGNVTKLDHDEHPRPETTIETLAKLKPMFKKDGVVTAGNASGIVDGAAAMVVANGKFVKESNAKPLGLLAGYAVVGCDPAIMGIGPAPAIRELLKKTGKTLDEIDLIEVNEAFAPQTLAVEKELRLSRDRLNVNGGAIAVGHPLAASGTRITMHVLYELRRRGKRWGIGSACIGGGQGIALLIEAL